MRGPGDPKGGSYKVFFSIVIVTDCGNMLR